MQAQRDQPAQVVRRKEDVAGKARPSRQPGGVGGCQQARRRRVADVEHGHASLTAADDRQIARQGDAGGGGRVHGAAQDWRCRVANVVDEQAVLDVGHIEPAVGQRRTLRPSGDGGHAVHLRRGGVGQVEQQQALAGDCRRQDASERHVIGGKFGRDDAAHDRGRRAADVGDDKTAPGVCHNCQHAVDRHAPRLPRRVERAPHEGRQRIADIHQAQAALAHGQNGQAARGTDAPGRAHCFQAGEQARLRRVAHIERLQTVAGRGNEGQVAAQRHIGGGARRIVQARQNGRGWLADIHQQQTFAVAGHHQASVRLHVDRQLVQDGECDRGRRIAHIHDAQRGAVGDVGQIARHADRRRHARRVEMTQAAGSGRVGRLDDA